MKKREPKSNLKKIAAERVKILFEKAKEHPNMGTRYIEIARKIAMKVNYKLPSDLRRRFCKYCNVYFYRDNYRVRTREKMLIYYCNSCKKYSRFGLNKKSK